MEFNLEAQLGNKSKPVRLREAIYMEEVLWEVAIDRKTYLLKKTGNVWQQGVKNILCPEDLMVVTRLIEQLEQNGVNSKAH